MLGEEEEEEEPPSFLAGTEPRAPPPSALPFRKTPRVNSRNELGVAGRVALKPWGQPCVSPCAHGGGPVSGSLSPEPLSGESRSTGSAHRRLCFPAGSVSPEALANFSLH